MPSFAQRTTLVCLLAFSASTPLWAQSRPPDASFTCQGDEAGGDPVTIGLAEARGVGRVPFLSGMNGCPSAEAACIGKTYIVPGDRVLTGPIRGDYVCAFHPNRRGGSSGWISRDRLQAVESHPSRDAWVGHWVEDDNAIDIVHRDNVLAVDGSAFYPGANPPPEQFPGGPNLGAMGGTINPEGFRATVEDEDCSVSLALVEPFLVVGDNHQCGGLNVRFWGVYQRQPTPE